MVEGDPIVGPPHPAPLPRGEGVAWYLRSVDEAAAVDAFAGKRTPQTYQRGNESGGWVVYAYVLNSLDSIPSAQRAPSRRRDPC